MLGETLEDPFGVEAGGSMKGMELLNTKTIFARRKQEPGWRADSTQLGGVFAKLSGVGFGGYEIHMGITQTGAIKTGRALTLIENVTGEKVNKTDGLIDANIMGSYIHGIFDEEQVAATIIECLLDKKGIDHPEDFVRQL